MKAIEKDKGKGKKAKKGKKKKKGKGKKGKKKKGEKDLTPDRWNLFVFCDYQNSQ